MESKIENICLKKLQDFCFHVDVHAVMRSTVTEKRFLIPASVSPTFVLNYRKSNLIRSIGRTAIFSKNESLAVVNQRI